MLWKDSNANESLDSDALNKWLGTPDTVVISGRDGDDARAIAVAAKTYRMNGVTVSVVISPSDRETNSTADTLRPYSTMMVLPKKDGYLGDLLSALGA
ncbi:hypothetical protein [Paraburkholderia sp. ZP32-5]|uniref:hypothetical protein n=1 Tax=Paraburkholderia sp. ZP32-5 TaxID=2883245 RepID=UPI001F334A2D|nr:hypothetical protein [Paraburkholderia sp. ZP32-5]